MSEVFIPDQGQLNIVLGNQADRPKLFDHGYNSVLCYTLSSEIRDWLGANISHDKWHCDKPSVAEASGITLVFDDLCDEVAFKLRWMN